MTTKEKPIKDRMQEAEYSLKILDRKCSNLRERVNDVIRQRDGLKARMVFTSASFIGVPGGYLVRSMMVMDGGWSNLTLLVGTIVGFAVFAILSATWLTFWNSL